MLLINFLKKASVIISATLSKVYLMLFLFGRYKITILLFSLLFSSIVYSQENTSLVDSIISVASQQKNDSLKIDALHKSFFNYCYSKPEVSRVLSERSIELSKKINNNYLLTRSFLRKGIYYDITGKKDSAIIAYDFAYDVAKPENDLLAMASVYNNKGLIEWNSEQFDDAMQYYIKSLKIFRQINQPRGEANSLNNIGLLLTELDRYKEAIAYHKDALKIRLEIDDKYGVGASYSNISQNYDYDKNLDSTLYYSRKAIAVKKNINDKRGLGISYNNLGQIFKLLKQSDSSIYYLEKANKIYKELNSKRLLSTNSSALGSAYNNKKEYRKAIGHYNTALELISDDELMLKYKLQKLIADAYKNLELYKISSKFYSEALITGDTIAKQNEKVATQEVFEKYQSAEKQKQILIQRAELAEQDLVIQKRNYQLYGLAFLTLILGLIGFLFYNQQKLKNQQLQKENELKDALIKIETQNKLQEQRLRISRDLHDNIGAQLTFIISSIDNLKYGFDIKDEKLTHKLETISDFTSGTIYELRDTIWAMNKSEITFEDLQTRISNYIDKAHLYDANIQFSFNVDNSVDTSKTFTSVEGMNIHRVIQEAIHNSLKYANASQIKVEISKVVSNLVFKISDNGKGFDVSTVRRGNGLTNMEKRIANIGGEIQIISKENQGTQVIVTV